MDKKVVRYKLVRHKWPDEIEAEKQHRKHKIYMIVACLAFFAGGFITSSIVNIAASPAAYDEGFAKLYDVYNVMNSKFYFGKDKKQFSDTLFNGALSGMVNAGDDQHTMYLDEDNTKSFTSSMEGSFVGIGVQYYQLSEGVYIINRVFKNSPAEEAGLIKGDQIYAVEGTAVKDLNIDQVSDKIKGSENSKVSIEIIRENKHITKKVERREVQNTVFSEIEKDTGILQLSTFAETSGDEVGIHLKDIKEKGCKNLVLDFRDNGGGYLISAQQIASYLLPENAVIFYEKERDGSMSEFRTIKNHDRYTFDKIVVLVDGGTASAAEVLTAALQEQVGAVIVGEKTYGKGTVQEPVSFKDGSMLKFTTAEWLTSKKKSINGSGITPDEIVALDPAITTSAPNLEKEVYKPNTVNIAAKSVQTYLKFLGYAVDRTDAYFSPASARALKQYQKEKGLKVTGTIDSEVITSLLSSCSLKWYDEEKALDVQMKKAMDIIHGK